MEVQKYLRSGKTPEDLAAEYGIEITYHPYDPLIILNYSQIGSPKMERICCECRGLVLEKHTYNVVARAFDRFFNYGEALELTSKFNWNGSYATDKEDGSLILIYSYMGSWRINTRGSFAEYNMHICGMSWADLVWQALRKTPETFSFDSNCTYVFEFCSLYNKVVRQYNSPTCYLIGVINHSEYDYFDFPIKNVASIAKDYGFNCPVIYHFKSIDDVILHLNDKENSDPTYEGIVVRDINGLRIKIKSKTYLALHRLKGNDNLFLPKNLVPFILAGETDEVITYFPECKDSVNAITEMLNKELAILELLHKETQGIEDQKEFALYIKNKSKFSSMLFMLRKEFGVKYDKRELLNRWRNSAGSIIKNLF